MNIKLVLIIFLVFVILDKGLTALAISQVAKNYPQGNNGDQLAVEKNPVQKWFFKHLGLLWGSIIFGVISLGLLLLTFFLLNITTKNANISLYILMMIGGLVVANNTYFVLKFANLLT